MAVNLLTRDRNLVDFVLKDTVYTDRPPRFSSLLLLNSKKVIKLSYYNLLSNNLQFICHQSSFYMRLCILVIGSAV
jgi:hypothetical protein